MDFLIVEVDGSLANPVAAVAVAVWTAILSIVAVFAVRRARSFGGGAVRIAAAAALGLATRPAQHLIGALLYVIMNRQMTSVGFWGGPPIWIAPAVSCAVAILAWVVV
jgi:hypothetical protein